MPSKKSSTPKPRGSSSTTPMTGRAKTPGRGAALAHAAIAKGSSGALALVPSQAAASRKKAIVPETDDDDDDEESWRLIAAQHNRSGDGLSAVVPRVRDEAYQPPTADEPADDLIHEVMDDGAAPRNIAQYQQPEEGEEGGKENEDVQVSLQQFMAMHARKAEAALAVQTKNNELLQAMLQSVQAGQAPSFGSPGAKRGAMLLLPGPTKYPDYPFLGDGKTKQSFGTDRAKVYDALLAVWVLRQGENGGVLPAAEALSAAAAALGVPANNAELMIAFGAVFGCAVTTAKGEVKKDFCSLAFNKLLGQHGVSPIKTGKTGEVPPHIQEHMSKFPLLKSRPPPYHDRPPTEVSIYMMAIHASYSAELGGLAAFEKIEWRSFFDNIFAWAGVPPAGARIDTPRALAHLVMVMLAKLTFAAPPTPAGVAIYGSLGGSWDQGVIEDIAAWLMDADKCPTTWAPLLSIRQLHGARWRNTA